MTRTLIVLGALALAAAAIVGLVPVTAGEFTCGTAIGGTSDIGAIMATLTGPDPCADPMNTRRTITIVLAVLGAALLAAAWYVTSTTRNAPTGTPGAARTT